MTQPTEPGAELKPARSTRAVGQSRPLIIAALLVIVFVGGLLRIPNIGRPFASSDHAELAAVVTLFYPRSLAAITLTNPRSSWHMLDNPHGIVEASIAFLWITVVGLLGVSISEWWWNIPFVLLSLALLPLGYLLAKRLGSRLAGVLAALSLALLPLHAVLSRASGLAHIPLSALAQMALVIAMLAYFRAPTQRSLLLAQVAATLTVLTDLLLPFLFVLLVAIGILALDSRRPTFAARLQRTRVVLFGGPVMRWPLLALCWPIGLLLLRGAGRVQSGGLLGRLFEGSPHQPALHIAEFIHNASFSLGPVALIVVALCGLAMLPALWRLEAQAIPLAWAMIYLAPFVLFSRPNIYGYFLIGLVPLVLNSALVLDRLLRHPQAWMRLGGVVVLATLLASLGLRSLQIIYGQPVSAWIGTGQAQGGVFPDQGLKAGAGWLRAQTPADATIFSDPEYKPYQLFYYLHRPLIASMDIPSLEAGYAVLKTHPLPRFFLVRPGNDDLLRRTVQQPVVLRFVVQHLGRPLLHIYGVEDGPTETIEAESGNRSFDAQWGSWAAMFAIGSGHR
ncbi:MAG: hypothetical protein NVS4B8_23480 [Herpetosiphon sp.]